MTPQLTGREAIDFAEQHGLPLRSYADPTSPARDDLTPEEALEIAAQDASLIYLPPLVELEVVVEGETSEAQLLCRTGCDFSEALAYERLEIRDMMAASDAARATERSDPMARSRRPTRRPLRNGPGS